MFKPPRLAPPALAFALALALGMAPARAAPEDRPAADSLMQLLQERGLLAVPQAAAEQVRQVGHVASDLVVTALNFLGVPYKRGGNDADSGFDCSGFVRHIFDTTLGLALPRRADEQASAPGVVQIKREELKPGDLVFFNTLKRAFSHVGIYVGDGKFIHSPRTGGEVRVEDMNKAYWEKRFNGARRVAALHAGATADAAQPAVPAPRH